MAKFIFGVQINVEVFYKFIMSFWLCVTSHAQSTKNKKFALSLHYLLKRMGYEVDFLSADKHESFLQADGITLVLRSQACPKYPRQQFYNIFAISQGKRRMKLIFCLQINVRGLFKWYYQFRCVWSGMHKLPKMTSLLFLCNILRKKWVMKLIFCMQMSMKACYKLILWFWWGWPSIPKVPKITSLNKFAMFLQYFGKEVRDDVDFFACR